MGTKFKIGDKFIPRKPKEEYPDIPKRFNLTDSENKFLTDK